MVRAAMREALARYGLDQSHEVSGPDGGPVDVNAWTAATLSQLLEAVRREGPNAFATKPELSGWW